VRRFSCSFSQSSDTRSSHSVLRRWERTCRALERASWPPWIDLELLDCRRRVSGRLSLPALAARAQLGDRSALEGLLRLLEQALLEHVRGIVNDHELADDVLQETLLIVSRGLKCLREPDWVRAWAYRIATREAVRAARTARDPRREAIEDWDTVPARDG